MLESTSKEQIKNLIDILSSWPLSQINNWQNDERIIYALAKVPGFNINKIKRFIPLFLNKLKSFLNDNGISINFNYDLKLFNLPGWEGLNVLLVDTIFNSFNQQNQNYYSLNSILSSKNPKPLNLYSTIHSIFKSFGLNITEAESNEITNEAWSSLSEKDRQALITFFRANMRHDIDQNFIDGLGDIAGKLIDRTRNKSSNNKNVPQLAKSQEHPR